MVLPPFIESPLIVVGVVIPFKFIGFTDKYLTLVWANIFALVATKKSNRKIAVRVLMVFIAFKLGSFNSESLSYFLLVIIYYLLINTLIILINTPQGCQFIFTIEVNQE